MCAGPARAHGLGAQTIVYVSCNPLSQIEDAKLLAGGYELTSLIGYDMFPQTFHVECVAKLSLDTSAAKP